MLMSKKSLRKPCHIQMTHDSMLSPTLFILHINDTLQASNILCYIDDNTSDTFYTAWTNMPSVEEKSRLQWILYCRNHTALDYI